MAKKNILIHHDRELHTLIAALRYWQANRGSVGYELDEIANNRGHVVPLDAVEISALVYRINRGDDAAFELIDTLDKLQTSLGTWLDLGTGGDTREELRLVVKAATLVRAYRRSKDRSVARGKKTKS